jgi:TolB-like protein
MILSFETYELDTGTLELRCEEKTVAVEPKVFDLLLLLATNNHRVVTRDEVIEKIWSGRAISDAALATCIKAARRAIGDDGKAQRLIRTLQRRGFHFVGDVTERRRSASPAAPALATSGNAIASSAENALGGPDMALPKQPSIAVLPFEVPSGEGDRHALAYGLARDITTRLGRARWLFVIARDTASQLQSHHTKEVGRMLGVRYVVRGSVQVAGKRVRINVALADCVESDEAWADVFDRRLDDIFDIQDEIAGAVVHRVHSEIELKERRRALLRPLASLDAWSAFHRACWHMDRHTPDDYLRAEALFKRAAELDPGSSRVFAGLSAIHRQRAFLELSSDRNAEIQKALELAQHGLSLDPNDPQARWAAGRALMLRDEVEAALGEFEMANRLNPSFALSQYSVGFGHSMVGRGDPSDEALLKARRLSPIDPMRFAMVATQAFNALRRGDNVRAADLAQLAAAEPNAHYHIVAIAALCNVLAGRREPARKYLQRLHAVHRSYSSADYFRAFPFQRRVDVATWRKGFGLLGLAG